jgi:high-affinity iron transporter
MTARFLRLVLLALASTFALGSVPTTANADQHAATQSILHSLDYVAVDYPQAVIHGEIISASEYREQQEFAAATRSLIATLPNRSGKAAIEESAQHLVTLVMNRASGMVVQALCRNLSAKIIDAYQVSVSPSTTPSLDNAAALFKSNCAECHGASGYGNGPRAAKLETKPINFHDRSRQGQRSIYSLYSTISLGINDTPMRSFSNLSDSDRWALAFYVSNFFATDAERARGELLWQSPEFRDAFPNLNTLTQAIPVQYGDDGIAVLAYLRSHPEKVSVNEPKPLDISRQKLAASVDAYKIGDSKYAYDLAVSSYLEGFELVETPLIAVDADLKRNVEDSMTRYRQHLKEGTASPAEIAQEAASIQTLLDKADADLRSGDLSPSMGFTSSLIILLREGLEAILVLAAIITFLIKTDRRDALIYVHMGWIAALLAGIITWYATKEIINYSSVSRTLTEGFTALFAAAMLLYVGYWLHNHSNADRWKSFIHGRIHDTVSTGAVWGLVFISFVAVYREVAETVLFYETLWLQTDPANYGYLLGGFVSAALILLAMAWLMFRLSIRLPLRLFFRANAALLTVLAVVFAGKGIAALQEAGKLRIDPINFPEIHLLGIYPTVESIGLQLALVALAVAWLFYARTREQQQQKNP